MVTAPVRQVLGLRSQERRCHKTEHFLCSSVIAIPSALVPVFHHCAEKAFADLRLDVHRARLRLQRMRCRPETARDYLWKMGFCQMAKRDRTEATRLESASVVCGYAPQRIHYGNSA